MSLQGATKLSPADTSMRCLQACQTVAPSMHHGLYRQYPCHHTDHRLLSLIVQTPSRYL